MSRNRLFSKEDIQRWLDSNHVNGWVNSDHTIHIDDNFTLSQGGHPYTSILKLPVTIKSVNGYFDCSFNHLTSLEGCPQLIGGGFNCSNNFLKSLKGCPKIINGNFRCNNNILNTLKDGPEFVEDGFYCEKNDLRNLKHAAEYIGSVFHFYDNPIKDLKNMPKHINCWKYLQHKLSPEELIEHIKKEPEWLEFI